MEHRKKRKLFLMTVGGLVAVIVALGAFVSARDPKIPNPNTGAEPVSDPSYVTEGKIKINDANDGEMEIPKYNIPVNNYDKDKFHEEEGIISYGDNSKFGITVREADGEIDWQQVKDSNVDFAMIRVGYRGYVEGELALDKNFKDNIKGAIEAGLDVGVYFYSAAVNETEAQKEAETVLEQIQGYQVTYPIAFIWEFVKEPKGTPRTEGITPKQVTSYAKAFCKVIKSNDLKPVYFTDKQMGYEYYDLAELSDYGVWYSEFQKRPAFYYNFYMWQYTREGTVPGIPTSDGKVRMSITF